MTSPESPVVPPDPGGRSLLMRELSPDDFVVLNDEIRAFVRAGIPLDLGLQGTAVRTDGALHDLANRLSQQVSAGTSIQDALAAEGGRLPASYRAIIAAGLRTGRIDEVLGSLSELAESSASLNRQLRLSLIYPAVVFTLAFGLFTTFVVGIVPRLERTYEMFDMQESVWVRFLQILARTAPVWGVAVPAVIIGLIILMWIANKLFGRRESNVGVSRWVPGGRDLSLGRFARVMSLLVEHGVPLPEACRISGQAAGDGRVNTAARELATNIEQGHSLSKALTGARRLPPFLKWLVTVGEQQGALAPSLKQAAAVYEQRALTKLDWFRRVVPPVTVVLLCGLITLFYGLTLFVPLTEMIRKLSTG